MATRFGLVQGLVEGLKFGINYWEGGGPVIETIYDQTIPTISDFLANLTGSLPGTDFSVNDLYACNDLADNGGAYVDGATNDALFPQGGATDTASPHGRAIVNDGSSKYWLANPGSPDDEFNVGTSPFAFTIRVKFTGSAPISNTFFASKGTGAGSNFGFGVNSSGNAIIQIRGPAMAPVVVDSGVNVMDGNYHWIAGGRSVTNSKAWITLAGVTTESAFDPTKDVNCNTREFGIWDAIAFGPGPACEVDHMIFWKGTNAEHVYNSKASFTFEDN